MVHNEPFDPNALVDQRNFFGNGYNESIETTVEANDHSIQTPFVIAVWILSASIAKIGKLNRIYISCVGFYSLFLFI